MIPTLQFGGAERLVVEIARRIDAAQFDLSVVTIVAGGPLAETLRAVQVPYVTFTKTSRFGLRLVWQLYQLFRRERPDIVHTHLFGADAWGKIAAWLARVPVVVSTEHNTWYDESSVKHRMKGMFARLSDRIIAISRAVAQYMVREEHVPEKKISIIRNGVDVDAFVSLPMPQPRTGMPVRFLSIGRLEPQKGFDILLEACSLIREAAWSLTIVGAGSQLSSLQEQARALAIDQKVQFYGTTDTVAAVMGEHDVFVLPSRWEGLGLVVMEAMAAGRAVIATRVGGVPESIEHGKTGFLVAPENSQELADALRFAIERRDDMARLGGAARAYAQENCTIGQMVRSYEALYRELLAAKQ